jgi:hypothetical protein
MTNEETIRRYLDYLEDPSILRDADAITAAEAAAAEATDKVDRLRRLSELERLKDPSADDLHAAFVRCAKAWADEQSVTAGAFMAMGVPPGVLVDAGFSIPGHAPARSRRSRGRSPSTTRAPGVSIDEVRAAVPAEGMFTVKQLRERSGASPGTVRKAMAAMLDEGFVVDRGRDAAWEGPGRVPTLYSRA